MPHVSHTRPASRVYVYVHRGYNTRHVILPARAARSFRGKRCVSLSFSLALERTLLRDRRECLHLSPPAQLRSGLASHKERFIVWRPRTRDGRGENSSLVTACRGRRQNTHKARLVNYNRRNRPHPGRCRAFRILEGEKKRDVAGHQMVIAIVFRCDARVASAGPQWRMFSLLLWEILARDTRWLDACPVIIKDFCMLNVSRISTILQKKFLFQYQDRKITFLGKCTR